MTETLKGPGGKIIGYVQTTGDNRRNIMDSNQRLVAREINGTTYDAQGRYVGKGSIGITKLK
jgi:hypothetical protein